MLAFTSVFKDELADYLALRQKTMMPHSYRQIHSALTGFDLHLAKVAQEKTITEEMIASWIQTLEICKRSISSRVSTARKFLEYLSYCGFDVFIPNCPKYSNDYVPYIYSDVEVAKIFHAADNFQPTKGRPTTYYSQYTFPMLIRLLYGCGLRVGEALSLRVHDINFETGTLLLREAKNKKQRIVPMHLGLIPILRRYCFAMRLQQDDFLFPKDKVGNPLSQETARTVFKKVLVSAGVYTPPPTPYTRHQCLHCFRHLFTIKSFAQAEQNGRNIKSSVPFLSVYLGHFDMDGTEKYLKFSGDMFSEHTEMFEDFASGVFMEVSHEE